MKKGILLIIVAIVAAALTYKFAFKTEKEQNEEKPVAIEVSSTAPLTGDIGAALQSYYSMKDAFTKSDTALVNQEATAFVSKVDSISVADIQGDPAIKDLAGHLKQSITDQTNQLISQSDLTAKRKSFQGVSDNMFDLLRSIRYDGSVVYQQFCPMAFDNAGAAWLSNTTKISNPYFGAAMPTCGDVRDSIAIAKQ